MKIKNLDEVQQLIHELRQARGLERSINENWEDVENLYVEVTIVSSLGEINLELEHLSYDMLIDLKHSICSNINAIENRLVKL